MIKKFLIAQLMIIAHLQATIIIPFGQSCTVASALREYGLRSTAYPFDWNVSPFNSLYNAFQEDFLHFLAPDSLHFRDDKWGILDYYGFHFVHDFPTIAPNDKEVAKQIDENHMIGGKLMSSWKEHVPKVSSKYMRRFERLFKVLNGIEFVYFIRHFDITKDQAIKLRNLIIKKYPNLNFTLVVINNLEEFKKPWNIENISNFYLYKDEIKNWKPIFETLNLMNEKS